MTPDQIREAIEQLQERVQKIEVEIRVLQQVVTDAGIVEDRPC